MARRKYPSDHRAYFRLLTDILDDPKLDSLSGDACWAYVRLLAMLQRTASRDGRIEFSRRSFCYAARRRTFAAARLLFDSVAAAGLLRIDYHDAAAPQPRGSGPTAARLWVCNWPKIQGITPLQEKKEEREKREEREPAAPTLDGSAQLTPTPGFALGLRNPAPDRRRRCPEFLSVAQWLQVRTWRDDKHPEFPDLELDAQWVRCSQHYRGEGKPKLDWVLTFYNWLTGPYYKPLTDECKAKAPLRPSAFEQDDAKRTRENRAWLDRLHGKANA